ncbi:glycosyltransferase [bacterium]|nr:MAG: glycosyltransferase [bacterium]
MVKMSHPIRINIASESEISVKGHGVHTAYEEMARALEKHDDVEVIRGHFSDAVDCDVIHLHTIGMRAVRKLLQRGPKKVVSVHVVPDSFIGSVVGARYWRFAASIYMRLFYNKADLLLAVSEETKKDLLAMRITKPIVVEYNSIDTHKYQTVSSDARIGVRKQLGIESGAFVVMGAGQVQPRKRLDSFIACAKALPDVTFVWVGGMPFGKLAADSAHMDKLIKSAPSNMLFPGIVDLQSMPDYYTAADMFFLPSDQETFGLVILEAAAAGLPVMVRLLDDYADSFGDDVLQCSETDFSANIQRLRDDRRFYEERQGRSAVLAARFDSAAAADRYVALYKDLIANE